MDNEIEKEIHLKAIQYATSWPVHLHKVAYEGFIAGHSRITELLKSLDTALDELQTKEVEYKECAVPENINYEYFKGKRDAYEFSVKTIKRVLQWHESLKGKQQ